MRATKYTTEFKERAVRLVLEQGLKAKQVAEELGVPASYIGQWKREYLLKIKQIKVSKPRTIEEATNRISELERELLIAKEERDILKKAVSFFAKQ